MIQQMVQNEDVRSPYTDLQIADILQKRSSIKVARRTVAKYRRHSTSCLNANNCSEKVVMGIFNRFVNVLRANANAALDQAEDPELMLTQMISDLETQKREAKQRMTQALALQKRFERQTEQEEAEAQKWKTRQCWRYRRVEMIWRKML